MGVAIWLSLCINVEEKIRESKDSLDIFARYCHHALIEFDGLAQCFEKGKNQLICG